jgi:hypothetical protein
VSADNGSSFAPVFTEASAGRNASEDGQVTVALAIVAALTLLGCGLIVVAYFIPGAANVAWGGVGTIIGALATALNAPTGVAAALSHLNPVQPKEPAE